jgi:hypothetical protein
MLVYLKMIRVDDEEILLNKLYKNYYYKADNVIQLLDEYSG